jgi:hypothetical protein
LVFGDNVPAISETEYDSVKLTQDCLCVSRREERDGFSQGIASAVVSLGYATYSTAKRHLARPKRKEFCGK